MLFIIFSALHFQNVHRVLDIYSKDKNNALFIQQTALLQADTKGLQERDIIVKEHFGHDGFKITLTGKDGGEKYSSNKVLELSKLYGIIDAMPMRQEEMSKNKKRHE